MKLERNNPDRILDETLEQIRSDSLSVDQVEESARKVWKTIAGSEAVASPERVAASGPPLASPNCQDIQDDLQAYLKGELPSARSLLIKDHVGDCLTCRRALREARQPAATASTQFQVPRATRIPWTRVGGIGVAAAIVLTFALANFGLLDSFLPAPEGPRATVASVEGLLFRVSTEGNVLLEAGDQISEGDEVRTGKNSSAIIELRDGSRVELNERAEVSLQEKRGGKNIQLARGNIIVEAAKQRDGYLYVSTEDCRVAVKGTVFSVNHGTKGSRVSVIEGEVAVESARGRSELIAGEQVSTRAALSPIPVEEEIAWSRNASEHLALLKDLTSLQRDIEVAFRPGLTTASNLVELAPEETLIFVSIPNLTDSIVEAHDLFQQKLQESPVLQEWWIQNASEVAPHLEDMLTRVVDLGSELGDEVVVWVTENEAGDPDEPVVVSEVNNEGAFIALLNQQLAELGAEGEDVPVQVIEDPFGVAANPEGAFLMVRNGLFAASPSLEALQELANRADAGASVAGTDFFDRIHAAYGDGVGYLVAVDLERILAREMAKEGAAEQDMALRLGLLDTRHLLLERRPSGDKTETRAVVSFDGQRRGIAGWLASPAPIGSLEFVSPDATVVTAFVVESPEALVGEIFSIIASSDSEAWQELVQFQIDQGVNIQEDVAAPLGGEVVFAIDGPILPTPSWKVILEVYDPIRFQQTVDWAVEQVNSALAAEDKSPVELGVQQVAGRAFYSLASSEAGVEAHYVFVDGYMLAAPSRALLQNAIEFRETAYTLVNSPRFASLLPEDGNANFSALFYQNMGGVLGPLAEQFASAIEGMSDDERDAIDEMIGQFRPSLFYAYGDEDRITVAGMGDSFSGLNMLGLSGAAGASGLPGLFQQIGRDLRDAQGTPRGKQ